MPIETLGITITDNSEQNYKHNFQNRITNLKTTLNIWKQRKLSLKGKITVINSLAHAPLIYASSVVDTPPKAINEINNKIIQHFLWDDSTSKISQHTLIQNIENGSLKLCHFETKVKALRLSWLKRLSSESQSNYKILARVFHKCSNLHTYFDANHKLLNTNTIPSFYTEIHKVYMSLFKQEPINMTEILEQSLWLNQNISIITSMYI